LTKDETLKAIIAGAKANGSWDKKYPDDDKKARPAQEPVAYCYVQKSTSVDILTFDAEPDDAVTGTLFPLYYAPPQLPWVGLTHQQTKDCMNAWDGKDAYVLCRAIEAKLKEANT